MLSSVYKEHIRKRAAESKRFDMRNLFNNCVSRFLLAGFASKVISHRHLIKITKTPYLHPKMVLMMLDNDFYAPSWVALIELPTVLEDPQLFKQVYAKLISRSFDSPQDVRKAQLRMRAALTMTVRRSESEETRVVFGTPHIGTLLLIVHYVIKFDGVNSESFRFLDLKKDFGTEIDMWVDENVPELKGFPLSWILETADLYI